MPEYPSLIHSLLTFPGRLTAEQYDQAIADLQLARTQLEPDGNCCAVCGDTGHQAWECHHNPLAMMREAWRLMHTWRCYHCNSVFTDGESARQHFGDSHEGRAACQDGNLSTR
jgi:hypothetical protein